MRANKKRTVMIGLIAACLTIGAHAIPLFNVVAEETYRYEMDLKSDRTSISVTEDSPMAYFYVRTDFEGAYITLMDADTDEPVATLVDDGKYSTSWDDLPLDGIYSTRIYIDNTGATLAEPKILSFYAIAEDEDGDVSVSNTIEIKIYGELTDQAIAEMAAVDEAINALFTSEAYKTLSFEEKRAAMENLLYDLAENGTAEYPYSLIQADTISLSSDERRYHFRYICGLASGSIIDDESFFDTTVTSTTATTTTEPTMTTSESAIQTSVSTTQTSTSTTQTTTVSTEESITTTTTTTSSGSEYLYGDVNADGIFNLTDVVLFQKWLLAVPDTKLVNWKGADFYADDVLNAFDLSLMKKVLIETANN